MRNHTLGALLASLGLLIAFPTSGMATAESVSLKVGQINLQAVKATVPEVVAFEQLKLQAEEQLKQAVDDANGRLVKMQNEKKPIELVEAAKREEQSKISAKQDILSRVLNQQAIKANVAMSNVVGSVAREKGLDLVVDINGTFWLNNKYEKTEDVTDAAIKLVQSRRYVQVPPAAPTESTPQTKPTAPPTQPK